MNLKKMISLLDHNGRRIAAFYEGWKEKDLRWKPGPEQWSMLEVINHLADEELEDFPVRLRITLSQPGETWPPIDPEGWVESRKYNQQEPQISLERFLGARVESLRWLKSLKAPDWTASYQASSGTLTAGDLLVSWVTHDQLHLRQLVELQRLLLENLCGSYQLDYAGAW